MMPVMSNESKASAVAGIGTHHDLGWTTSIDVIAERIELAGQSVIDVGCGDMTFSRALAARGAAVLAVDPDPAQAALNRAAEPTPGLSFIEAGAEALPVPDASLDGVFFSFSLHHVPADLYPAAFAEVRRVLKPGGVLCVIEPADCPLNEVMKHFHDEDAERAAAQQALLDLAVPMFETHTVQIYRSWVEFESFEAFAARYGRRSFNPDYDEADVRHPATQAAFERLGAPDYRFESPKHMMLLERVRPIDRG